MVSHLEHDLHIVVAFPRLCVFLSLKILRFCHVVSGLLVDPVWSQRETSWTQYLQGIFRQTMTNYNMVMIQTKESHAKDIYIHIYIYLYMILIMIYEVHYSWVGLNQYFIKSWYLAERIRILLYDLKQSCHNLWSKVRKPTKLALALAQGFYDDLSLCNDSEFPGTLVQYCICSSVGGHRVEFISRGRHFIALFQLEQQQIAELSW